MRRIVDGKLRDTECCTVVASITKKRPDVLTGVPVTYQVELLREIALKPGATLAEAREKTSWGGFKWDESLVDYRRGQFLLYVSRSWSNDGASLREIDDDAARSWFEEHRPDDFDTYEKYFGKLKTVFDEGPRALDATALQAELERARKESQDLKAQLEKIRAADAAVGGMSAAERIRIAAEGRMPAAGEPEPF